MPSNAFARFAQKVKEHHDSVNAAYTTYYGVGEPATPFTSGTPSTSARPSARPSMESQRSTSSTEARRPSSANKAWQKVKKAAKDHHQSVNEAYATLYAPGATTPVLNSRTSSARPSAELRAQ